MARCDLRDKPIRENQSRAEGKGGDWKQYADISKMTVREKDMEVWLIEKGRYWEWKKEASGTGILPVTVLT